jgi:hypothetical protein
VELLNRGYGRPAQSVDLHLTTEAITRRLSDMTDAELAALEARMITIPATLALEHVDEPQVDGDTTASTEMMMRAALTVRTAMWRIPRRMAPD